MKKTIGSLRKKFNLEHNKGKSWRDIAKDFRINVGYIYRLTVHGIEPSNPKVRDILGLPSRCPNCKRKLKTKAYKSLWDIPTKELTQMYLNREEF